MTVKRQSKEIMGDCNRPPPRSRKYAESSVVSEQRVKVGDNSYLMRQLSNGAVELVRYDIEAGKWVVLCFPGIESDDNKAAA